MTSDSGRSRSSLVSSLNNWIIRSTTRSIRLSERRKSLAKEKKYEKVIVLHLGPRSDPENAKIFQTVSSIPGISSVSLIGNTMMNLTGNHTIDVPVVLMKLKKHWPATQIFSVQRRKRAEPKKRAGQLMFSIHDLDNDPKNYDHMIDLELEGSGVAPSDDSESSDEITTDDRNKSKPVDPSTCHHSTDVNSSAVVTSAWTDTFSCETRPQSTKGLAVSGSGGFITTAASKSITTTVNIRNPNGDWHSFCEFLNNRQRPFTLSGCRAEDAIDFLHMLQTSSDLKAVVGCLRDACEAYGIKPKDNPFRTLAVITYVNEEREKTGETECVLVFSFNGSLDAEERFITEAILKELHDRKVTPWVYDLSGRENLDAEMFYSSSVSIVIVSDSFARRQENWDRLVELMDQWNKTDLVIIPVYIKFPLVDHQFDFMSFEPARVQKWKAAMSELDSIDRHQWKDGTHFMVTKEVARSACLRLYMRNSKNLGRILALLNHPHPCDVEIEGIWGMAGIGKTSIAREIFGILAPQYDLCYFLQDFHQMFLSKGLRQIRDGFISKLFGEEQPSITACDLKPSFMRDLFHNKSILVILDDVSNAKDVEAVVGGFGWFSRGHRIILTSRQKQVLVQCKVQEPYEIQKLCEFEAFRLCRQYLDKECMFIISELMSYSSGIPLALKVLSSSVSNQHMDNMMEHFQGLRRNPPPQIQETFRRSFDGLDKNDKNVLLDLACFFRGDNKDRVVQILDACGFFTSLVICDLIDESLISLVNDNIEIPIPYQDVCRFIVHEEDEDPCERSRLWDSKDIIDVLTNNSGTEAIEGIFLDASDLTCELSCIVFAKMYRLRLLKFYCSGSQDLCNVSLPQGLDTLPDELRLLHWENYPLEYLPQKFNPENLVELNMPYSNMEKLWEGKKNLEKLRRIKLSHSRNLTDILILSGALNLEHIDLEGCTSLVDVSTSFPRCGKLVSLNMKDCSHLRSLPAMVDLTSLNLVNLSGCSELEEIQDFAGNLKELYLAGTAIRKLPLSTANLTELVTLDLENCRRLQQLPFGIRNLTSIVDLKLSGCTSLESLPDLEALTCGTS